MILSSACCEPFQRQVQYTLSWDGQWRVDDTSHW